MRERGRDGMHPDPGAREEARRQHVDRSGDGPAGESAGPGAVHETGEGNQTLWQLATPPLVWAVHFLACYLTAAVWCAKAVPPAGPLDGVRSAVGVYTAVALAAIGVTGWLGWKRHRHGAGAVPHEFDTPGDRHRFLGFATVLLAGLSAVATVWVAAAALYFRTCL